MEEAKKYLQQRKYRKYLECVQKIFEEEQTPENRDLYNTAKKMYKSYQDVLEFKKKNTGDYYELLDVSRDTDAEKIKRSYRKLVLRFHPDRSLIPESGEILQAVLNAYNTLIDPEKRARYANEIKYGSYCRNEADFGCDSFFTFDGQRRRHSTIFESEVDFYSFIYNLDEMSRIKNIYRRRAYRVEAEVDAFAYLKAVIVLMLLVFIIIVTS